MDDPFEFDDAAAEALLAGDGAPVDGRLASFLDEARSAYGTALPAVDLELSAFFRTPVPARRSRVRLATKVAAALAAAFAATGGLAVAGALPPPVQNALSSAASDIGVPDVPTDASHSSSPVVVLTSTTTTTQVPNTLAPGTTSGTASRHGATVSAVARSAPKGCAHGRAVSAAASGKTNPRPCPTHPHGSSATSSTTTTTTPTVPGGNNHHGNRGHHSAPPSQTDSGSSGSSGPTTTTPTGSRPQRDQSPSGNG
jgi:hypothetical protein